MNTNTTLWNWPRTLSTTPLKASGSWGIKKTLISCFLAGVGLTASAQNFYNLDFELATRIRGAPTSVSFTQAFPGWTGYCGTNQLTAAQYDREWLDTAGISILDSTNAFDPAAGPVTHGRYCACLYSGFDPNTPYPSYDAAASIAQTGWIPTDASSIQFNYSPSWSSSSWGNADVVVTFNGIQIPLSIVSGDGSGTSVLSGDVSQFAGQIGELRFTAPSDFVGYHSRNIFLLDYIRFLPTFTYVTNNGTITITGYNGLGGAVTIPSTINGLPVTSIGDNAFYGCSSLTGVTIPDSVTSIGYDAFCWCSSLTNVTLGNSLTNIGRFAFCDCLDLTSITVPDSVTSIGDSAFLECGSLTNVSIGKSVPSIGNGVFFDCTNLRAITADALNPAYSSIDGVLFNKSQTTLIQCPGAKVGSYTIPNAVTNIGGFAFSSCYGLKTIIIPESVTSIGDEAFYYCTNLTNVTIPNGVTSIGNTAFGNCISLTCMKIPDFVTSLGYYAFYYCSGLTNVTIGKSVSNIGEATFYYCTHLTSVTIPEGVTSVGRCAFYHCSNLASLTIPDSVIGIMDAAFCYCTSLTSVYFQGNAPSLEDLSVFTGDSNATVYFLPWTTGWGPTFGGRPTAPISSPPNSPPVIVTPPSRQAASVGDTVDFAVVAAGSLPLGYQWFYDSSHISGATNSGLRLLNVQLGDAGAYMVVVTNLFGSVTSSPAILRVLATTFTNLHNFCGADGSWPQGGVLLSNNVLYGAAASSTVFRVNLDGTGFLVLWTFHGTNGANPYGTLVLSGDTLYGTTASGGTSNYGTIFKVNTDGTGFATLFNFNGTNGALPIGGLVLSGETLYGTTENGGLVGKGTLFRIGTDGSGFATLHNFEGSDGSAPYSTLVMSGTALYGTTVSGGNYTDGTVFTINTDGTDFSILHHFSGSDGRQPYAGLLLSGHILYGTTMFGGTFDLGTVFKVSTDGSDFATIYSFSISYGYCPNGMPVLAGSTLYGTLSSGGMGAEGAIFAVNIDGTGFTPIHSFEGCVSGVNGDGAVPYSGLVVFGGMLYGTAVQGGACGGGSVFASALLPMGIPSAANITVATLQDHPLKLAVAKLLALTHGPEGDALALTGVSAASTNGGSVVLGPDQITYTPAAGYIGADCFIYSVSDAMDATASAYVFVQVLPTNQISGNMLPLTAIPGGYQVSFAGIPGRTYSVQRAPTINGPWVTIGTIRVGSNGLGIIQDTNPPEGAAFYRTTYP